MRTIIFVTNNSHKLEEVRKILSGKMHLVCLKDINCFDDIPETSDTLEGNALQKACYIKENYGYDCFSDDTGLEVEALNNEPGVRSARYAGEEHDSNANVEKLLRALGDAENRKAHFRTVIALIYEGREYFFEGKIEGRIIMERRGSTGFGYDPVFVPEGYDKTFAELDIDEKNKISHRAIAVKKLSEWFMING